MNRRKAIIVAASITGIVLVTILALGFDSVIAKSNDVQQLPVTPDVSSSDANSSGLQKDLLAWQQYSQQLEQTVIVMQQRETQYRQQLASANQTIVQLQNEINSSNSLRLRPFSGEREGAESGVFDD
jgi:hypothetical protein